MAALASLWAGDASAEAPAPRIVHADVVALDQLIVYNRFGSFNPYGMIFALRRDVSALGFGTATDADRCREMNGTEEGTGELRAGAVRLKDCKRARPLVLRAGVGDILEIKLTNLLRGQPDVSRDWCGGRQHDDGTRPTRSDERAAFREQCEEERRAERGENETKRAETHRPSDWPATRGLSLAVPGLEPLPVDGRVADACRGLGSVAPNQSFVCRFRLDREGTHLFSSLAAPSGGEGDGGSVTHGLFGAIVVESEGATALRSQVPRAGFDKLWPEKSEGAVRHARRGLPNYAVAVTSERGPRRGSHDCGTAAVPVILMTRPCRGSESIAGQVYARAEIVHGDLNAIIVPHPDRGLPPVDQSLGGEDRRTAARLREEARSPFREFTVVFHDELKTYYADRQRELSQFAQLSAARDGFAINYGSSGAGAMVLANRKGIGPTANCPECLYEEFFLESWANGDPALLENYVDDPSNVHHSYLNDKVVFRNFHVGKETHVFHLHTHQWFAGNDENRGAYLDSQTIAPQQGFTYRIYHGGLDRHRTNSGTSQAAGWWETAKGSGNRNRTVGDAIFHCHLYPHFAQGMWALWRVHDVLEDGSRVLPDGQKRPGLSVTRNEEPSERRPGSVDPETGRWLGTGPGRATGKEYGTPIPGVVPIPGEAAPLIPVYTADAVTDAAAADGMPGYPFFIAGVPGHRAPQPPLDMARASGGASSDRKLLDGGLPRHVVTGGLSLPAVLTPAEKDEARANPSVLRSVADGLVPRMLALGDVTSEYERLHLKLLPHEGTQLERNAMGFHHDGGRPGGGALPLRDASGDPVSAQVGGSYPTLRMPALSGATEQKPAVFSVNGAPPAPGAPYADPCGAASTLVDAPFRRFIGHRVTTGERDVFEPATLTRKPDPAVAGDDLLGRVRGDLEFIPDPGLLAFRRYAVSAIQFDMTVNRAGWHDPQARIAVLTSEADSWKETRSTRAEPFFFRGFSGECIELRHTNELPKDLELDDFQLRVPTDTIGQHIHLVKFDVTSADGSGNGFNYEDGTFAPDEILARICAARSPNGSVTGESTGHDVEPRTTECETLADAKKAWEEAVAADDPGAMADARKKLREAQLWWRKGDENRRKYFQTTVQRWFADPILSNTGDGKAADRTLRTVFTHDHFGPSNIQHHGYYAALLIEPNTHAVERFAGPEQARSDMPGRVSPPEWPPAGEAVSPKLADGDRTLVGARAVVEAVAVQERSTPSTDLVHPNTREMALAIADFAVLYDGARQGRESFAAEAGADQRTPKGLARLVAEARCRSEDPAEAARHDPDMDAEERVPARTAEICLEQHGRADEKGPAPNAGKAAPNPKHLGQVTALDTHAGHWRNLHGRPVAPPPRPEAFSQKHHDPYLVNYRNEPLPLRVGTHDATGQARLPFANARCTFPDTPSVETTEGREAASARPTRNHRDVRHQLRDRELGDMSNVFRSAWKWDHLDRAQGHGDPCTPLVETYARERLLVRLVQGAQEVQHSFVVEGLAFRRNADQAFPSARNHLARLASATRTRNERCHETREARDGRPREQRRAGQSPTAFWDAHDALMSGCDNILGLSAAQEVGLSEHFEFGDRLSATGPGSDAGPGRVATFAEASGLLARQHTTLAPSATGPRRPAYEDTLQNRSATGPSLADDTLLKQARVPLEDLRQALDYNYNFGSADALWNGAWGLIRVYDRPESDDIGACLTDPARAGECIGDLPGAIGDRMPPLADRSTGDRPVVDQARRRRLKTAIPAAGGPNGIVATAQPLVCPDGAQQVEAVMVAVRAGEVLDIAGGDNPGGVLKRPGMTYDPANGIYDPDALMIASLTLAELAENSPARKGFPSYYDLLGPSKEDGPIGLPDRAGLIALLKKRHKGQSRPEPYVLRVHAGDCVNVLTINALQPVDDAGGPGRIKDVPGDALLPRIVPLNSDPLQTNSRGSGLRPSSRVSFTMPASSTTARNGVIFPFGINQARALLTEREAKEENGPGTVECRRPENRCLPRASWATQTFFVGELGVDAARLTALFEPPWAPGAPSPATRIHNRQKDGCPLGQTEFAILSVLFCVESDRPIDFAIGAANDEAGRNARIVAGPLGAYLRRHQASFLIARPYAYGALPIRVAGDVVGHASHGLFGMLVVEPRGSGSPGRNAYEPPPPAPPFVADFKPAGSRGTEIHLPRVFPCAPHEICSMLVDDSKIREHALFVQDGLNLWSRTWAGERRLQPVDWGYDLGRDYAWSRGPKGYAGHPLANCPVCDDSYDMGEKGVSYRSAPFARRLAGWAGNPAWLGLRDYPVDDSNRGPPHETRNEQRDTTDLNAFVFPPRFFSRAERPIPTPTLDVRSGQEVMIRVAHPAGRARQRSFVTLGASYDDLLPGFGTGHSAHLAPGKSFTASFCAPREPGDYIYRDGPQPMFAGGAWGHVAVARSDPGLPQCVH